MNQKETWIGLAHVRPYSGNNLLGDARGAFVPVVGLAESDDDFASSITTLLNTYEFEVLSVEDIELFENRIQHEEVDSHIVALASKLTTDNPIELSVFEAYERE